MFGLKNISSAILISGLRVSMLYSGLRPFKFSQRNIYNNFVYHNFRYLNLEFVTIS